MIPERWKQYLKQALRDARGETPPVPEAARDPNHGVTEILPEVPARIEVDKQLRAKIAPIFKELGFENTTARKGWLYREGAIGLFDIYTTYSIDRHTLFWPSSSLIVEVGILKLDGKIPLGSEIKKDSRGRLMPPISMAAPQLRKQLRCNIDQTEFCQHYFDKSPLKSRKIWWIENDGSNISAAMVDIERAIREEAIPFFREHSMLEK